MSTPTIPTTPSLCQASGYPDDPLHPIILGGSVNLLAGAPGTGKTALMADMMTRFRDGRPIFGRTPAPLAGLGVISADRSWDQSSSYWFKLAGIPEIAHYSLLDDLKFDPRRLRNTGDRVTILEECFNHLALPPQSLVLVDPLSLFLGGKLNDYDTCAVYCMQIQRLARKKQYTLIGLAHAGKQQADVKARYLRLQDRILGSAALFGYTDTQMYIASPEETGQSSYTFLWHPHHAPKEFFSLTQESNGLFRCEGSPISPDSGVLLESLLPHHASDDDIVAWFPPDGTPKTMQEIKSQLTTWNISRATLMRTLARLVDGGRLCQPAHGAYAIVRPA